MFISFKQPVSLILALELSVVAPAPGHSAQTARGKDVVDTVAAKGSCKTLTSAVKSGGLTKTLKGKGPYTLFAPNDAAFGKLPKGKLDELTADKSKLGSVLKYHVVPKKVSRDDIKAPGSLPTLHGQHVITNKKDDSVWIDGAAVIEEIPCKNGVVYIIDEVLAPERGK
jgi:uncharacterized surface protein with fasciclin (FAS1) repeats